MDPRLNQLEPGLDMAASIAVRNENNVWVNDSMVNKCHKCKRLFDYLLIRKHHCRACGNIFCYKCASKSIEIPDFITSKPEPADYWNLSYYIKSLKTPEQRVCIDCYTSIKSKMDAHEKMVKIFDNPVSLVELNNMVDINNEIKTHYMNHLRNIQYYLPNHTYSELDKKLLKVNAPYLIKHSKYIVHLIKSMNWTIPQLNMNRSYANIVNNINDNVQKIVECVDGDKCMPCSTLLCTRTCREKFSCDDCINILYSTANFLPDDILRYLFSIIGESHEDVILCHLSFFVNLVKNNTSNTVLQSLLYEQMTRSIKLVYHSFWFLNNAQESANIQEVTNIKRFIELFVSTDHALVQKMTTEYMFFLGLVNNLDDPKKYLIKNFETCKPISLPYAPNIDIIDIDYDNISIKSSYTKPVLIPFITTEGIINILIKKESVMNDVTVLNLMTLCDIILRENIDEHFGIIVYPIMPLTANSGMIEIVDQAETIHSIIGKKKTIFQHIIERNENRVIHNIMERYMYSLVSYTLHSYFIGLGDRHLQNIMITDDGAIFHIDFGFILGTDAYPLTATEIKLNSGMLDVIGGADSHRYETYLNLCSKGVIILRKYFNLFFILLCQDNKFSKKHVEKFIMSRFQPRQKDSVVVEELMTVIKRSHDAYSDKIRDFLHYHTQEKTVQNGATKIIKDVIGAVRSFTSSG